MPSGRTHDSITLWSLPVIAACTFERTRSSSLTLMVAGGFLFGGLMFGPDLDVYSRQYLRWGPLRWIWLPYRQNMRHRSFLSHGPIVGTVVRVLYLLFWLGILELVIVLMSAIVGQLVGAVDNWQIWVRNSLDGTAAVWGRSLQTHSAEWIALVVGLELGAISHSLSDWIGSAYKRYRNSPSTNRHNRQSLESQMPESGQEEFVPPPLLPPTMQPNPQQQNGRSADSATPAVPPHLKRIPRLPPFGK